MPIRRLPPLLVNQIAAGEVIERPASVVKELMENAIDAGATRIDVAIEQGGKELIRIADNGRGISEEELPLALAAHATSKIESADDLDAIATMGFRGEALASIASVSRISITSRPNDATGAAIIRAEGDQVEPVQPISGPVGTTVAVRNLFFNTPARRKFLRTDQTESTRVRETVQSLAMSHPQIGVTLSQDGRTILETPAEQSARRRVLDILGPELEPELLELETADRGLSFWGMVGKPAIGRSTARHIFVFINGRRIVDRSINHAIKEAYRGLLDPTRHPTLVLFMQIDPGQVDVNVHPTKAEVRFRNQGVVHGAVLNAVRQRLRDDDLTPQLRMPEESSLRPEFGAGSTDQPNSSAFVDYFRRLDTKEKGFVYTEVKQALANESPEMMRALESQATAIADVEEDETLPQLRTAIDVLQLHSSFVVTQDESGLLIIDQHALHERVMFEKLQQRITKGDLESQRLLMPAVLNIDRDQVETVEQLQPLFKKLGIEVEPMGPTSIAVQAFTSLLFERNVDPVEFLTELLTKASEDDLADNTEAALHEVLDMMACKAAIKAGDRLSETELAELLKYRNVVERSSNCPHGRPTTLRLTISDLEKQFGRR